MSRTITEVQPPDLKGHDITLTGIGITSAIGLNGDFTLEDSDLTLLRTDRCQQTVNEPTEHEAVLSGERAGAKAVQCMNMPGSM